MKVRGSRAPWIDHNGPYGSKHGIPGVGHVSSHQARQRDEAPEMRELDIGLGLLEPASSCRSCQVVKSTTLRSCQAGVRSRRSAYNRLELAGRKLCRSLTGPVKANRFCTGDARVHGRAGCSRHQLEERQHTSAQSHKVAFQHSSV